MSAERSTDERVEAIIPPFRIGITAPDRPLIAPAQLLSMKRLREERSSLACLPTDSDLPEGGVKAALEASFPDVWKELAKELSAITPESVRRKFEEVEENSQLDRLRRLDVYACQKHLQSIAAITSLTECVSSLTKGQHLHYLPLLEYIWGGRRVPAESLFLYPDLSDIIRIVEAEQKDFFTKLRSEVVGSSDDCVDEGYELHNHNYLESEHVLPFVGRLRGHSMRRALRFLNAAEEHSESNASTEGKMDFVQSFARRSPAGVVTRYLEVASEQLPADVLSCSRVIFSSAIVLEKQWQKKVAENSSNASTSPLDLQCLDSLEVEEEEDEECVWVAKKKSADAHLEPLTPAQRTNWGRNISAVHGVSMAVPWSSLLQLFSACHVTRFRLPLSAHVRRCDSSSSTQPQYDVRIQLGHGVPLVSESRRQLMSTALRHLVHAGLPSSEWRDISATVAMSQRNGVEPVELPKKHPQINSPVSVCLSVMARRTSDSNQLAFDVVKVEYTRISAPPQGMVDLLESLSPSEALEMQLIFLCFPSAVVRLHRVQAFTQHVLAVEVVTASTFASYLKSSIQWGGETLRQAMASSLSLAPDVLFYAIHFCQREILHLVSEQVRRSGDTLPEEWCLDAVLQKVSSSEPSARTEDSTPESAAPAAASPWLPSTANACFKLSSVTDIYKNHKLPFNYKTEIEEVRYVEPPSTAVCLREALPPASWPLQGRIPFTHQLRSV